MDISYGGALYAFVSAEKFGLDVNKSKTRDLVDAATAVSDAVKSQVTDPVLLFLTKTKNIKVVNKENWGLFQ